VAARRSRGASRLGAALLVLAPPAWAFDLPNAATRTVAVVGAAADGSAYALRVSWTFAGDPAGRCHYPDVPERRHPDGVALVLCRTGGTCEAARFVYQLPRAAESLDERLLGDLNDVPALEKQWALEPSRCTPQPEAVRQLAEARRWLASAGVVLGAPPPALKMERARDGAERLLLPAGALASRGVPEEVALELTQVSGAGGAVRPWLLVRREGARPMKVRALRLFEDDRGSTPVRLDQGFLVGGTLLVFLEAPMLAESHVAELGRGPFAGAPTELPLESLARALRGAQPWVK
jgi:hypothetical protein